MKRIFALLLAVVLLFAGAMYWSAATDPVMRRLVVTVRRWPSSAPTLRLVLLSDLHVAGPENPPARLARLVARVNALHPDIVLIAGDFVTEKRTATRLYSAAQAIEPLGKLRTRLGTFAVMGNHDHWLSTTQVHAALAAAGIRVLDNRAVRVGPVAVGGIDDVYTRRGDLGRTLAALRPLGGLPILLTHSPDIFPDAPVGVPLTLAGHTHCGQIVLPVIGALATASRYGGRFRCGLVRERGKTLLVSAGVGTSLLPLRLGAPSDFWVIDLMPRPA